MAPALYRRFLSIVGIEYQAFKLLPRFVAQYIHDGMGRGGTVRRNRVEVNNVKRVPWYTVGASHTTLTPFASSIIRTRE